MRVLMFGRGVIAAIYGQAFAEAGHDVEFLVRPGRAAQYGDTIELNLLDTRRRWAGEHVTGIRSVRLRESLAPDDGFDLVVLSVGHHRLSEAAAFLAPRIGDATVLVFGNLWDEPDTVAAPLPLDRVVWGFPQAGGGFQPDGVLRGALLRRVMMGRLGWAAAEREEAARDLFRSAGIAIAETRDLHGWLQVHFALNAGMHTQGLRLGGLARMVGRPEAFREAMRASRELLPVLAARGVDLRRHRGAAAPYRMPWLAGGIMSFVTSRTTLGRATLVGHTDPDAEEPRRIVQDALHEARRHHVSTPRLEAAATLIAG
jgi:2-dehydropantoate 2-reductase